MLIDHPELRNNAAYYTCRICRKDILKDGIHREICVPCVEKTLLELTYKEHQREGEIIELLDSLNRSVMDEDEFEHYNFRRDLFKNKNDVIDAIQDIINSSQNQHHSPWMSTLYVIQYLIKLTDFLLNNMGDVNK